jgi:hypothetical protein
MNKIKLLRIFKLAMILAVSSCINDKVTNLNNIKTKRISENSNKIVYFDLEKLREKTVIIVYPSNGFGLGPGIHHNYSNLASLDIIITEKIEAFNLITNNPDQKQEAINDLVNAIKNKQKALSRLEECFYHKDTPEFVRVHENGSHYSTINLIAYYKC